MNEESPSFAGLRVASFESRRADDMRRLIERAGGKPRVSPSMRETPVVSSDSAVDFAYRLISGQVDMVVLMTGVGTRKLVEQIERRLPRERFLDALSDIVTIARGPKPAAALKEFGLRATHLVPEPNTWRELLAVIDGVSPILNQTVAIQEYGSPNPSLIAGLEARGATVLPVKVYGYDFPEDLGPLELGVRAVADGDVDVALFTSAHQVVNVLRMAQKLGLTDGVRAGFDRLVIASIGPTTSETLRDLGLSVDLEPDHPKMGSLVQAAASRGPTLLAAKRASAGATRKTTFVEAMGSPRPSEKNNGAAHGDQPDSLFLRACRRLPTERPPIWLMRQAGRYMPEYREVRARQSFLELCRDPALCAEVMITAVKRLDVDAAIIFADLLPMLVPLGFDLEFTEGEGPLIRNPLRGASDLKRIRELEEVAPLEFVMETVRLTKAGLPARIPVIGFAGAPFTLASYAIEGGSSRNYAKTKQFMYEDPGAWHEFMGLLSRAVLLYLQGQIAAGANAVQLFDSWVGCLGPEDYREYVLPHVRPIFAGLPRPAASIHFAAGNPALLPLVAEAGGDVIGVDWRIRLADAWKIVGHDRAVQGNLDPVSLLGPPAEIRRKAEDILRQALGRPGHIFNLGHGILPQTPVDNVLALIEAVRAGARGP